MENLSDIQLVKNIQCDRKTEDSLQELINRHSGIYLDIVHSYMKHCPFPDLRQDIINDKAITIYNTALKYDENRGAKFSTFLGNEARWKCLNTTNKNKANNKYVEINENKVSCEKETEEVKTNFEEDVLQTVKEELANHPDKRIKKIFEMRYSGHNKLTPWRKISDQMNLSIQGCINIHNAALKNISKNIKSKYEIIG